MKYESIIVQAYWFAEGGFWNLGADGYISDDSLDDSGSLDLPTSWLEADWSAEDVKAELRAIAFAALPLTVRGVSLIFEGNEFEFLPNKRKEAI